MTDERFWSLVRKSKWYKYWRSEKNAEICRKFLDEALAEGELEEFSEMISDKKEALEERITSYYRKMSGGEFDYLMPDGFSPNGYLGDDTISDGLFHIVGSGKTCYNKVMKNPDKLWENFHDVYDMMSSECFFYVVLLKNSEY